MCGQVLSLFPCKGRVVPLHVDSQECLGFPKIPEYTVFDFTHRIDKNKTSFSNTTKNRNLSVALVFCRTAHVYLSAVFRTISLW